MRPQLGRQIAQQHLALVLGEARQLALDGGVERGPGERCVPLQSFDAAS